MTQADLERDRSVERGLSARRTPSRHQPSQAGHQSFGGPSLTSSAVLALQCGAGNQAAASILQEHQTALVSLQRDSPSKKPSPAEEPLTGRKKEIGQALAVIGSNWAGLRQACAPYDLLKPWLEHGQATMELLRAHTMHAISALNAKDSVLVAAYTEAIRTDKITYDYIAWHLVSYVNLLSIRSSVRSLIVAFEHDRDRPFTNRAEAERMTRELQMVIDGLPGHSASRLSLLAYRPLLVHRKSGDVVITVTSPQVDDQVATVFAEATTSMRSFQANVQVEADFINEFVDEAFTQGLGQASDALEEYYLVKTTLGGKKSKRDKAKGKKQQPGLGLKPIPAPRDNRQKRRDAAMRLQVQWNSRAKKKDKGEFGEVTSARADVGVGAIGAIEALRAAHTRVVPMRAKEKSQPAVAKQIDFIRSCPPGGLTGQLSRTEKFPYDYPDARVDVENLRGRNLRF